MNDNEEECRLTASEVCLATIQEDDVLGEDKEEESEEVVEKLDSQGDVPGTDDKRSENNEEKQEDCVVDKKAEEQGAIESESVASAVRTRRKRKLLEEKGIGGCNMCKTAPLESSPVDSISENNNKTESLACDFIENAVDTSSTKSDYHDVTGRDGSCKATIVEKVMKSNLFDDMSQRSKETSESDTRVSTASENSTKEVNNVQLKKKKKKAEIWYKKKRRRVRKKLKKVDESNLNRSIVDDCGSGNTSPSLSESVGGKNRKCSDSSDNSKKTREFAIPSPSLADINMKAAIPESTATSVEISKQGPCLCRRKPQIFVSGNNSAGDLYCQGLDCINTRIVGCCNPIPSQDVGLFRASEKACYQMMCNLHQQRLLRHNCCPGCGLFCTRGRFLICKSQHLFHKACALGNEQGMIMCPHCGDDTPPKAIIMFLNSVKDPILLPQQKPPRTVKAARMSIMRGVTQILEDDKDPEFNFPTVPFGLLSSQPMLNGDVTISDQPDIYKAFYTALENGDVNKVIKMLASGVNPNLEFEKHEKRNALHVAAVNGHTTLVHVLLQARTQINAMDEEQNTPLVLAIIAKHNDVVKYLIKCGANLNLKNVDGMTPLHIAAKCGNIGACYHILNGTNLPPRYIDGADEGGWTPMVWASEFNHIEVVRFLRGKGANPLVKDIEQNIALHWAAFGGSIDIVELYLNDGLDINAVNVHGDTPLHIAARQDKYNCVLLLLARGAKSDLKNEKGEYARDCSESSQTDIYKAISLNMEISSLLGRFQNTAPIIIANDISHGKERNQIQCVNSVDDEPEPEDFVYVTESCFTSKITVDRRITSLQNCKCRDSCTSVNCNCAHISIKCWYDNEGRLQPDFNYVNPPTIFECNQGCQCNRITCHNRVVQNGISCRFQLFRTETRGWGIKTLNSIPKGTYVCEYVGEIISDCEADHREDDSYLFDLDNRDGETYCIDARRYGNFARFINHMCVPNLMPVHVFIDHQDTRFPRIAFFANRDIMPNEELGYNYGEKFWMIKWKSFTCSCGSQKCMYSDKTIKTTLENYNKKMQEESA